MSGFVASTAAASANPLAAGTAFSGVAAPPVHNLPKPKPMMTGFVSSHMQQGTIDPNAIVKADEPQELQVPAGMLTTVGGSSVADVSVSKTTDGIMVMKGTFADAGGAAVQAKAPPAAIKGVDSEQNSAIQNVLASFEAKVSAQQAAQASIPVVPQAAVVLPPALAAAQAALNATVGGAVSIAAAAQPAAGMAAPPNQAAYRPEYPIADDLLTLTLMLLLFGTLMCELIRAFPEHRNETKP